MKTKEIETMNNNICKINVNVNDQNFKLDFSKSYFSINVHRVGGGINFEAMNRAVYTLSPNAFVVYMFMVQHSTKIVWNFRLRTIEEKTNMSSNAISTALLELLTTGYLTPIVPNDGSDTLKAFDLWETPDLNTNAAA